MRMRLPSSWPLGLRPPLVTVNAAVNMGVQSFVGTLLSVLWGTWQSAVRGRVVFVSFCEELPHCFP